MPHTPAIAMIGGGAAAVCALDALAQRAATDAVLTVFEPADQLWRGRAYQHDMDSVRTNVVPDGMSVRHGDKRHFARWLAVRDLVDPGTDTVEGGLRYPPRTCTANIWNTPPTAP